MYGTRAIAQLECACMLASNFLNGFVHSLTVSLSTCFLCFCFSVVGTFLTFNLFATYFARVKSRLQKYRVNRQMDFNDSLLGK